MASLTTQQLDEVHADIMRRWSRDQTPTPITKSELTSLLSIMDTELDAAEVAVITTIPGTNPGRQWLIDNQPIARQTLELVEAKRKDVL